jgi:hypothetical protein
MRDSCCSASQNEAACCVNTACKVDRQQNVGAGKDLKGTAADAAVAPPCYETVIRFLALLLYHHTATEHNQGTLAPNHRLLRST